MNYLVNGEMKVINNGLDLRVAHLQLERDKFEHSKRMEEVYSN